jgi:regulatory protein
MTTQSGGGQPHRESGERLAPVIPLFGGDRADTSPDGADAEPSWRSTWDEEVAPSPHADESEDDGARRSAAEARLLRKLRTRSLSLSEARQALLEAELTRDEADEQVASFVRLGYLDDAALAEQLIRSAVERKGQGRKAIALQLAKRGIPRDVADAALTELPDDDRERALEFARTKARSMGSLERDTALRRLGGQLARRGYPSSVSLDAARRALDEQGTGVRFR